MLCKVIVFECLSEPLSEHRGEDAELRCSSPTLTLRLFALTQSNSLHQSTQIRRIANGHHDTGSGVSGSKGKSQSNGRYYVRIY